MHEKAVKNKTQMYTSQSVTTLFAEVSHGYKHLSFAVRHYIQLEKKLGKYCAEIGCKLTNPPYTISREVKRNTGLRGYRYPQADHLARQRHEKKPKYLKITPEIKFIVEVCLRAC